MKTFEITDVALTGLTRTIRQICLIPYILFLALGCAVVVACMTFDESWRDEWHRNL